MDKSEVIGFSGKSTLRAWPKGLLSNLELVGIPLQTVLSEYADRAVYTNVKQNLIVLSGKVLVAKMLNDEEDGGLTYHAIGTDATAPDAADVLLGTESNRKAWTTRIRTSNVILHTMFYLASECTYDIQECGVFGSAAASASLDTGVLFSRYLQPYDNTAGLVDLTFEYELTLG